MQCPECNHIPLAGSQADPSRCPQCGIFYQKAIDMRRARDELAQQQVAAEAVSRKALENSVSPKVKAAMFEYRGAQPVVVIDVNMSFNSMVVFMIKWALASIPAMIMLCLIFIVPLMIFGVLGR